MTRTKYEKTFDCAVLCAAAATVKWARLQMMALHNSHPEMNGFLIIFSNSVASDIYSMAWRTFNGVLCKRNRSFGRRQISQISRCELCMHITFHQHCAHCLLVCALGVQCVVMHANFNQFQICLNVSDSVVLSFSKQLWPFERLALGQQWRDIGQTLQNEWWLVHCKM